MMNYLRRTLALTLIVGGAAIAPADEPKQSLDDQLLQDLTESPMVTKPKPSPAKGEAELDRELMQDLTEGQDLGQEKQDPLHELAQRMKQSQQRIAGRDTSDETQKVQREISDRLAQLIEQVQKQSKSGTGESKSGSGKGGTQGGAEGGNPTPGPASESTQRVGKSETVERGPGDVNDIIRRVWGHLPEKMREQMQNSLDDQFLPKYEKLIEDYYRRLAEERGPGT